MKLPQLITKVSDVKAPQASVPPSRVLFPLGLGTALSLVGDATMYTVLPTHTLEAGIALGGVGILLSANRVIRLFLNGPAGVALDRWPRRRLFVPALFIGALSTALYAVLDGLWPLLAARLLWGVAWSGIWVGGTAIILDVTTDQDRGRWTGLYQTWFFLGAAFGAFVGGTLTDWMGYRAAMWVGAALTAVGGLTALILLPETRKNRSDIQETQVSENTSGWREDRGLWLAISLQGVNRLVIAGVLAATVALLVQDRLVTSSIPLGVATLTGVLTAARTLLSTVAAPMAGVLSDRLGGRWQVSIGLLAISMLGMLLLGWGGPVVILVGIFLGAAASGGLQALTTAVTGDRVDAAHRGRAIGLLHTSGDLGSAIGPVFAYALLPWVGLEGVYLLCAGIFALSLFLALRYWTRRPGWQSA